MEERLSAVRTLYRQLRNLRSDVSNIKPEHAAIRSIRSSGITAYIRLFNSLLERTRQLYLIDPSDQHSSQLLGAIDSIEPVKAIEERLDVAYHIQAKEQIIASSGMLLEALEGYMQSAVEESTPVTQPREFAFIGNHELRKILERDYQEIQQAFIAHCWKSVIILSGGAIEAILMDLLMKNQTAALGAASAPKGKSDIATWDLVHVINVSVELGLVSSSIDRLSHSVREYRNLIHPGNEMRNKLTFDKEEARIALEVLNMVHRDCS